jgi:hypothetical protein
MPARFPVRSCWNRCSRADCRAAEILKNNGIYRLAAEVLGIYGNSKQEAMDPIDSVGVTPAF